MARVCEITRRMPANASTGLKRLLMGGMLTVALVAGGCSGSGGYEGIGDYVWGSGDAKPPPGAGETPAQDDTTPVAELYNKGMDAMNDGDYNDAVKSFEEVERLHPYSSWATRATLMSAYADYQRSNYVDAINSSKRFIQLHPGHKDTPYAYYLVALSHYEQISDTKRDQTQTEKALASLEEVSRRYPGTPYAADAEAKAVLARDHLAAKEMKVGRYYLTRQAYVASINRFKKVLIEYQTTSHTPEALYRLTEAYLALGIVSEAQTAAAILGHNFPNSEWYKSAYSLLRTDGLSPQENSSSWISRTWNSVTGNGS
ncbi:MAG: outer membrane protein assembly factor BamD [Hyphomicrobiales bacterium]